MSLNNKWKLSESAKILCRELRKNATPAEEIFWQKVRNKRFEGKKFRRQYPVFHDITGTETFFIADYYCPEEKLIVELDGRYHQYKLEEDENRTEILNQLGLRVIRFKNEEVINDIEKVLEEIKRYL